MPNWRSTKEIRPLVDTHQSENFFQLGGDQPRVATKILWFDSLLSFNLLSLMTPLLKLFHWFWYSSFVGFTVVPTQKKRRQKMILLSHLDEFNIDFMIGRENYSAQFESRTSVTSEKGTSKNATHSTPLNGLQVDIYSLERNITGRMRSEVDEVIAAIETRVHKSNLTAMKSAVIPRVELVIKSVNASSGRDTESVVRDADQRDFPGKIDGFQMTASSRIISNTDLSRIDETRGNNNVAVNDLSVNENNSDHQTHTHHTN